MLKPLQCLSLCCTLSRSTLLSGQHPHIRTDTSPTLLTFWNYRSPCWELHVDIKWFKSLYTCVKLILRFVMHANNIKTCPKKNLDIAMTTAHVNQTLKDLLKLLNPHGDIWKKSAIRIYRVINFLSCTHSACLYMSFFIMLKPLRCLSLCCNLSNKHTPMWCQHPHIRTDTSPKLLTVWDYCVALLSTSCWCQMTQIIVQIHNKTVTKNCNAC